VAVENESRYHDIKKGSKCANTTCLICFFAVLHLERNPIFILRYVHIRLTAAAISAGCIFFSFYPDLDNIGSSANPGTDLECIGRAVGDTGAAFHTGVEIDDNSLFVPHFHDVVGADMGAEAAADAFFRV
jgi:hypothetical protein